MSDARSQLAEVDALIAACPDDPSFQSLRDDLLQLIALEEQVSPASEQQQSLALGAEDPAEKPAACVSTDINVATSQPDNSNYLAQGTFTKHVAEAIAEAPDLAPFQPVVSAAAAKSAAASNPALKNGDTNGDPSATVKDDENENETNNNTTEKKKKKKKKSDKILDAKFELPAHLIPLDSDTAAQKEKKRRTAKALKSKFREKQKEIEHSKRQNDWKSFASGGGKKKAVASAIGSSIFATEEGANAKVGVISGGGGGRKMTNTDQGINKRHKFN